MKTVLIIDDEPNVIETIRELLVTNNYTVCSACDGQEGLRLARNIRPDLIICDIAMPGLTGYEVIKELRNEAAFNSIPFIFLTARTEISDIRSGIDSGADDYITKPFRAIELLKAVETKLKKFEVSQWQKFNSE